MANGGNDWGVSFGRISFLDKMLRNHGNVREVQRDKDILFTVKRINQNDTLTILCTDEYAFGLMAFERAVHEFGHVDILYSGGVWAGYTKDAKKYCLSHHIGLYNAKEIMGGLWRDDYWNYAEKDEDGNKVYNYKAA